MNKCSSQLLENTVIKIYKASLQANCFNGILVLAQSQIKVLQDFYECDLYQAFQIGLLLYSYISGKSLTSKNIRRAFFLNNREMALQVAAFRYLLQSKLMITKPSTKHLVVYVASPQLVERSFSANAVTRLVIISNKHYRFYKRIGKERMNRFISYRRLKEYFWNTTPAKIIQLTTRYTDKFKRLSPITMIIYKN